MKIGNSPGDPLIVVTAAHLLMRKSIFVSVAADSELIAWLGARGSNEVVLNERSWVLAGDRLRTRYQLDDNGSKLYATHPDSLIDIAAFPLTIGVRGELDGGPIKVARVKSIGEGYPLPRREVTLGMSVFFLGFPNVPGTDGILPVLRAGSIARIGSGSEFLIDGVSLGGNSGSPVFLAGGVTTPASKPALLEIQQPRFLGMVVGHLGQSGVFVEPSGDGRVTFVAREIENLGLARACWSDDILKVAEAAMVQAAKIREKMKP
ncbi:MAG: hypothetical protein ACE15D_18985 [Candidatus Eisenbacteria bacterium]